MIINYIRRSVILEDGKEIFLNPSPFRLLSIFSHKPKTSEQIEYEFTGRKLGSTNYSYYTTRGTLCKLIGKDWFIRDRGFYRLSNSVTLILPEDEQEIPYWTYPGGGIILMKRTDAIQFNLSGSINKIPNRLYRVRI